VLPPPRSRKIDLSYQETNSVAKLFLATVSLKEGQSTWPVVLKGLNTEDEPRIRTLLLELRQMSTSSPQPVLEVIEEVCIQSKEKCGELTRAELLERALSRMGRAAP
jgi:hypothetical protein